MARILFDESHSEAWTIRRELAEQMQPAHPGDSSYALAAETLANRDFDVAPNAERALTRETLAGADVLVIAHPSDPRWEATTNARAPRLSDRELDAIEEFVRGGGGLIALGRDRAGEVRKQPQRPARPLRDRGRQLHRPGLRAPPRGPVLGPRRARERR